MKVRKGKTAALVAVASLGLSACSIPVALSDTSATLGATPYLQVHVTPHLSAGGPAMLKAVHAVNSLNVDIWYQSTTATPLARSLSTAKSEIIVNHGTQPVLTIVDIHSNEYLNVNIAALAKVPGIGLSRAQLASVNLILGGRWFEFPYSLVAKFETSTLHLKPSRTTTLKNEILVINSLVSFFAKAPTTATPGGYTQTGTLASLAKLLSGLTATPIASPTTAAGTYTLAVTMNGNAASAVTMTVVTPNGKYGNGTLTLKGTFAHRNASITAPTNALVITNTFLRQLGVSASSLTGITKILG